MIYPNGSLQSDVEFSPGDLLLIRHGITDMAGTLCGQSDPPLNEEGHKQAKALASLLESAPVGRLYSSDLQRAVQTALPLADAWNIAAISRKDLREISFGDWEGKRWAEIRSTFPHASNMDSSAFCATRGETFAAFRARVLRAVRHIVAESSGACTAVVTHLGVIRVLLGELFPPGTHWNTEKRIEYCAVYCIRRSKGSSELLTISTQNDTTAHLRGGSG